jgi:hypothetical protein
MDILIPIKLVLKKIRNLFQDSLFFLQEELLYVILKSNRQLYYFLLKLSIILYTKQFKKQLG